MNRRRFLGLTGGTLAVGLGAPAIGRAQSMELKIGYMPHPIHENSIKWMKVWAAEHKVTLTLVPTSYEVYVEKMTANIYGRYSVGELSGWIFFSHQVGSAIAAALNGWIFEWTGSYAIGFFSGAMLAFIAAGLALLIREEPLVSRPTPAPAPAIS